MNNYSELKEKELVRLVKLTETDYHLISDRFDPMTGAKTDQSTEKITVETVGGNKTRLLDQIALLQSSVNSLDALLADMAAEEIVA